MNIRQIWQATLADLEQQVTKANYQTWLRNTWALADEGDTFLIGAPNSFAASWLEEKLQRQIKRSLARVLGREVSVRIVVSAQPVRARTPAKRSALEPIPAVPPDSQPEERDPDRESSPPSDEENAPSNRPHTYSDAADNGWMPNPRYTFDSFVVGSSNQLATAACRAVADAPGHAYNPLLVYGGAGLGKTHLLHAIGHTVLAGGYRTLYVPAERFTNELVNAIQHRKTEEFRQRYRRIDVLLIDDIQFIAGKDSTQEEYLHTFNELHDANGQIVLSSDRPPKAMATLEERLRSRFEWGLIADIQPPDYETRLAILQRKSQGKPLSVPLPVLDFIAQRILSNIRELEGALNRVIAFAMVHKRTLSVEVATSALSDIVAAPTRRRLTPQQILDAVVRYYRTDVRSLRGKARDRQIVLPRQVAMFLLREETRMPLVEIGRELGSRDHTTVLHGCEKIQSELEVNERLRQDVATLRETLYSQPR